VEGSTRVTRRMHSDRPPPWSPRRFHVVDVLGCRGWACRSARGRRRPAGVDLLDARRGLKAFPVSSHRRQFSRPAQQVSPLGRVCVSARYGRCRSGDLSSRLPGWLQLTSGSSGPMSGLNEESCPGKLRHHRGGDPHVRPIFRVTHSVNALVRHVTHGQEAVHAAQWCSRPS